MLGHKHATSLVFYVRRSSFTTSSITAIHQHTAFGCRVVALSKLLTPICPVKHECL